MTPQISLHPEFTPPDHAARGARQATASQPSNLLRLDVIANHLPQKFLGIAFDLVIPGQWQFDHAELCGSFGQNNPNIFHLVSPQQDNHRVVFGLAIGGGGLNPQDGCIASFYFNFSPQKAVEVSFERTTVSVYNNGRRDLSEVQWQGTALNFSDSRNDSSEQSISASDQPFPDSQQLAASQQQAYFQQQIDSQQLPNSLKFQTDLFQPFDAGIWNVYFVIFCAFLLVLAVFVICLIYYRTKDKR